MKKITRLFPILFFAFAVLPVFGQISDQEVESTMKRMTALGRTPEQIATALVQSGATREQLVRIKARTEKAALGQSTDPTDKNRLRTTPYTSMQKTEAAMEQEADPEWEVDRETEKERDPKVVLEDSPPIFGHNIFRHDSLTFQPRINIATPENYVLGPGDEVIIDVWGNSQQTVRRIISPDGSIVAEPVGMVRLAGLSVAQARERVKQAFASVYSLGEGTQLNLSLGEIRSIQVHVMGEVTSPGTYTVSSLATLFNVLYNAGGVNDIGSLRDIRVNRGGKQVAKVDVYEYLMHGRSDLDVSLHDGDVVLVQPYTNLIAITGKVKRPMRYEMLTGETLGTLLGYAGGFTGDAYTKAVGVERRSGREYRVFNVDEGDFGDFLMSDMDEVSVGAVIERFENRVEVLGAVFRPGVYALGPDVSTVRELVERAEGLRGDVFAGRAVLYRLKDDYVPEAIAMDLGAVMRGEAEDIELCRDDVLEIPSIFDLKENCTVNINGQVARPGVYPWADNMTLEDLVVRAGGLLESASEVRVDVAQRIKDPQSEAETGLKAIHLCFTLKDGLVAEGDRSYFIKPFDVVYVRRSPAYSAQQNVDVSGQVMFAGEYALTQRNERLSELVRKAGGLKSDAYVKGAQLMRLKSKEEFMREQSALGLTESAGRDSLNTENILLDEEYAVAIELEKALKQPGSDYDLVLREGDRLYVPTYQGTVMITGAVIHPNTVAFRKGSNIRHYIATAGGFASRAFKRKAYVIHMNGMVEESRFLSKPKVTPGSMVVVPMKSAPRNPISPAEIIGMSSSVASMAAVITSIMSLSK